MGNDHSTVIERLAETYPQLYLDPDKADIGEYKSCVLQGKRPDKCSLSHFVMDERDSAESIETPAGTAEVITLHNRHDFEVFVRCMMAAKSGPRDIIPPTMGASTIVAFNWPKIDAHKAAFYEEQQAAGVVFPDWGAEFKRFTAVKANYQDLLIVLSRGPYSNVTAAQVSECMSADGRSEVSDDEWTAMSGDIRKYHELTHFVCRTLYPDKIDEIWDELAADAVGIYGATGEYSRGLEELFLGITDGRYTGGRLENYTPEGTDMDKLAVAADAALREFESAIRKTSYGVTGAADSCLKEKNIFDIMILIEELYDSCAPHLKITEGKVL